MLLLLLACEPEAADHGPDLAGTVTAATGEAAEVVPAKAFASLGSEDGRVLISPNPDATCDDAAAFYGNDPNYNPDVVSLAGHCLVDLDINAYAGAGAYDASTDVTVSLNCAMDDGSWVFEERTGRKAWYYDGPYWQGSPEGLTAYTLELGEATDGEPFELTLGADAWDGRFIYDNDEPEADPATGEVAGWVQAEWCDAMDAAP